jgi:hypothetical protein
VKNLFKHSVLATLFLTMISCSDDSPQLPDSELSVKSEEILIPSTATVFDGSSFRISSEKETSEADEFAKLIATSLKDRDIRKFIKDEANKQFDGDFDILVSKVINAKVGNEDFIDKIVNNSQNSLAREIFEVAKKNPKLNISVPVLNETWDDVNQQLLVAVAIGAVENTTEYLKAFDSNGKVYLIDANIEPDVPVIVIGNNERMDYEKETKESNENMRTSGNLERITYIKCPRLGDIESWYLGAPELRFDGVVYSLGSHTAYQAFKKTVVPSRSNAKDGFTLNQGLFNWYFDTSHGPDYYIQSWEIDNSGTTYKLTVGVTAGKKDVASGTASFELSYTAQDRQLPGELIHYTSATPKTVSDSYLEFKLEN